MSNGLFGLFGPAPVNITKELYAIASVNGDDAEITMRGNVVQRRPRNFWTGKEVDGNFIVADEFLKDVEKVSKAKRLTIRINSLGGDVYAGLLIHNKLRELKAYKTVIVEAVAMSAGSMIMCAGDIVKVYPTDLIMVHKCSGFFWDQLNADQLRAYADHFDTVDKAIVAAYHRKTGLDDDELLRMMKETTYMTGREAVDKKFADELLDDVKNAPKIAASADRRTLYINGEAMRLYGLELPNSIPVFDPSASQSEKSDATQVETAQAADEISKIKPSDDGGHEGGKTIMAKTLQELRAEDPELAEALIAEAKAAASTDAAAAAEKERKRLEEIDEIAHLYDDETVREAKYGKNACTAQEMAYRAAQKAAKVGAKHLEAQKADFEASGAKDVAATPTGGEESAQKKVEADVDAGVKAAKEAMLGVQAAQGGK